MKKILSIVLALAIVVSCFAMLVIATGTEPEFKGAKYTELDLTSRGTYICGWQPNWLWKANEITDDLDGTFKFSYTIYNVGAEAMKAQLKFNTVGYTPTNVPTGKGPDATAMPNAQTQIVTIEPGSSAVLEISITANNGWTKFTTGGVEYSLPLNYITIRLDVPVISGNNAARSFVVVNNGFSYGDYLVDHFATNAKWNKVAATKADLPKTNAGIKYIAKEDKTGDISVNDYNRSPWANDATFTGQKKLDYVVYNLSNKEVKAQLNITILLSGSTKSGDAETKGTVTIPAGYKGNLSALVNVENGVAKLAADGTKSGNLNLIRLRFILTFKGGAKAGDAVIIAPAVANESDFVLTTFAASGVNKELVSELPAYNYTPAPATPIPTTSTEPGGNTGATEAPTVTEAPKYIAAKFEEKTPSNTKNYICNWGGGKFLEDDATFNGVVTVKYRIYNTSQTDVTVNIVYNDNTGKNASVEGAVTADAIIEPGAYKDLEISIKFANGQAVLNDTVNVSLSKLRVRINYQFAEAEEGNSFIVASNTDDENDYIIKSYTKDDKFVKTMLTKDQLPKVEAPKVPTGITLSTTEEADGSGKLYFTTTTTGGLVTKADIKDGTGSKTFKIKNNGEAAIEVKLDIQALVNGKWKSPSGSTAEFVTIEPGKTAEVTCEFDCENGTVTIDGEEVAISKLFGKFSIGGEDGTLPEGTSFTIYFAEGEEGNFAKMVGEAKAEEGWKSEIIYTAPGASTGDVLPIALIATIALASVAFVVVSKKRKED